MLAWLWKCVKKELLPKNTWFLKWGTQVLQGARGRSAEKKRERKQPLHRHSSA